MLVILLFLFLILSYTYQSIKAISGARGEGWDAHWRWDSASGRRHQKKSFLSKAQFGGFEFNGMRDREREGRRERASECEIETRESGRETERVKERES